MKALYELIENLTERQKFLMDMKGENPDKRNKAWELYNQDPEGLITMTYGQLLSRIEIKSSLTDLVRSLGGTINRRLRLKKDEVAEMHLGWFVFIAYLETGILNVVLERPRKKGNKRTKHASYGVRVLDIEALNGIMEQIDKDNVELFPLCEKPSHWIDKQFYHPDSGYPLIKKDPHEDAVRRFKEEGAGYLVAALNKLGGTGWRINPFVFDVFKKCKYLSSDKTPFKFMKEIDKEKRVSLEIEARAIERLAERHVDSAFYHLYNADFRGRIYPNTAFLHEQSSDNAKGLLLLDEPVPLKEEGLYWLSVHTANMWGNDKVSLDERMQWTQENLEVLLSYVDDPMLNDDWMNADKPFCFLACCYELFALSIWQNEGEETEDFPSCLPIYIDGSNNGVQHLAAMSKDEEVAPLVNLTPQTTPGDVYMFIAEKTIGNVKEDVAKIPDGTAANFPALLKEYVGLLSAKSKYSINPKSELYAQADQRLREFGNLKRDLITSSAPLFWDAINSKKLWRKTVKRPVMTLGYGGTRYGMVDMVHEDTYGLSDYLRDKHKSWSSYLGNCIYKTCYEELHGPAAMLKMFESLGENENNKDKPIAYKQVVTGFPFVHRYKKAISKKVDLKYGERVFQLYLQVWKEATLHKEKQKQSAAPNIVHSIDAVHLTMYIHDTNYPVTVVHDSFGCHAGNMEYAFHDVRKKFVELYELEPLEHIMSQMDALHLIPEKGTLNVAEVLNSDFAFA